MGAVKPVLYKNDFIAKQKQGKLLFCFLNRKLFFFLLFFSSILFSKVERKRDYVHSERDSSFCVINRCGKYFFCLQFSPAIQGIRVTKKSLLYNKFDKTNGKEKLSRGCVPPKMADFQLHVQSNSLYCITKFITDSRDQQRNICYDRELL